MDDCNGPNVFIASRKKTPGEKVNSGIQTDSREYRHQGFQFFNISFSGNLTFPTPFIS